MIFQALGNAQSGLVGWLQMDPIMEINSHFILRNEKKVVDYLDKIILLYAEIGLPVKFINAFK